ncbi:hypothetical protein [Streptococcus suis]|uniref:hypothetical protein n=1 Tax=Streptococcus suis TaxID=1307 RepID=UPI001C94CB60|nr:hypothetical protein [Streptococcus suis]MBY5010232.1 hypothetical protein [Streptococcus suis]
MNINTEYNWFQSILLFLGKNIILICSAVITGFLSFISLKSTGYMKLDMTQTTIFSKTDFIFYFSLSLVCILLVIIVRFLEKIPSILLFTFFTCIFLFIGLFISENAGELIRSDPNAVLKTAIQINSGDFSSFEKIDHTHYMATFPSQMGLLTLFRIYSFFTTDIHNLFKLQIFLVCISNYLLWKIAHLLFDKKIIDNLVIILSHLFLPTIFLTLWIYGDIPGLLFVLLSLYFYLVYHKNRNIIYFLLSIIFVTAACLIRANYLIFLVLLFLLHIVELIKKPSVFVCLNLIILPIPYFVVNSAIHHYYESKIQENITYPPQKAWIVMGLNDKVSSPGYWDGYTNFIREWTNYNDKETEQVVNRDFNERLEKLTSNPKYAKQFFYKKLNVTWNEPTFQSIFVGPLAAYGQTVESDLLQNLYSEGTLYQVYNKYMSVIVTLLYISSFIYSLIQLLFTIKDYKFLNLIPYIYLIGGFSFHIFWEVKSRYVIPYVYFLILICAANIYIVGSKLLNCDRSILNILVRNREGSSKR